jgi:hypothetical protein
MLATSTDDYGLTVTDPSILRVANTPETEFLQQAELRAIEQDLEYVEAEVEKEWKYYGYINEDEQFEGVGIRIFTDGY